MFLFVAKSFYVQILCFRLLFLFSYLYFFWPLTCLLLYANLLALWRSEMLKMGQPVRGSKGFSLIWISM